jgi:hypothetical protein
MADELNNKKNIDDSKRSLDDFNDALRDSIDYARDLAKTIKSISIKDKDATKGLANSIKSYNDALRDTLKLSDKVAKGRVKQEEIEKQAISLQTQYNRLLESRNLFENEDSNILKRKVQLHEELEALAKNEAKLIKLSIAQNEKFETVDKRISNAQKKKYKDPLAKTQAQDLIKELKKEQKERLKNSDNITQQISLGERLTDKKREELKEIDNAINDYEELITLYEKLLELQELITKENKEQSTFEKLKSNDIKKFSEGFKNILSFAGSLGAAFKPVLDFAFKISSQTTQLQKNLVLSKSEARSLRQDFNDIAVSSDDIAITNTRLLEANTALGKQLGFNSKFTPDLNKQFVKLTKQLGLSEEAAGGLAKLSIATGATLEDTKNTAYETTQTLSSQYGIQLSQREVLEEIGKASGQTLAMFKANPKALAEAVAQAKLLGTTLEQTKKQASSLLNFETSIENELQAELLTGQQLNLERARTAALMGDQTTVMKELANQNIDFNKFSNMNVIAQDKVAAALGLSSDELSDQLLKQQYLGKSREEIIALGGKEIADRVEAISAQDKFNLAVEKMQDLVGKLVGGPLGKLVDLLASAAEHSWVMYGALVLMTGLSFTKMVVGLAAAAVNSGLLAASSITVASALSFGVGAIAIAAGIGLLMSALLDAQDEAATPMANGGLLYGPTNILAGEYSGAENNPEVIAPLSDLQDIISNTNRQTVVAQDNSEMLSKFDTLIAKMENVSSGIGKLNNKEGNIFVDSQRLMTATLQGNYNLA